MMILIRTKENKYSLEYYGEVLPNTIYEARKSKNIFNNILDDSYDILLPSGRYKRFIPGSLITILPKNESRKYFLNKLLEII